MSETRTLVATARDGSKVTCRTSAGYTQAAIARGRDGWYLLAKGFSIASVEKRARTALGSYNFEVRPFKPEIQGVDERDIPETIRKYFDRKREMSGRPTQPRQIPQIVQAYYCPSDGPRHADDDRGWTDIERVPATYAQIRKLAGQGALTVGVTAYGSPIADFPIDPMLRQAAHPLLGGALIGSRTWPAR